jgi:hypothetical protein
MARGDAGEGDRCAVAAADADHVAEREDLEMPGQGEIGLDRHAPRAVLLRAGELGQLPGEP